MLYGIVAAARGEFAADVLIILIGAVVSWLSSFCLYGFGELIVKTNETSESTKKIEEYMRLATEKKEEEHK